MSDDLRLRATVDDKASGPIRDIGRAIRQVAQSGSIAPLSREFAGLHGVLSTVGRELRFITVPALGALGLVGGGVIASVVGITKSLAGLADKTLDLRYLSKELNFASNEIKAFGAAAEHFRIDRGQATSGLRNFARNVEDLKLNLGGARDELLRYGAGDVVAALRGSRSNMEALAIAVQRMQEMSRAGNNVGARRFAELMFGDAAFARMNADEISKRLKMFGPQSADEIAAAEKYADAVNQIGRNFESLKNRIGAELLPHLSGMMKGISDFFDERKDAIAKGIGDSIKGIAKAMREIDWEAIGNGIMRGAQGLEQMSKAAASIKDLWWIKVLRWMFGGSDTTAPDAGKTGPGAGIGAKPSNYFGSAAGAPQLWQASLGSHGPYGPGFPGAGGQGSYRGGDRRYGSVPSVPEGAGRPSVPEGAGRASVGGATPDYEKGGSAFLREQRKAFADEIETTPGLRERIGAMALLEGAKDPVPVIEALANRYGYVNAERKKRGIPPLTVDQMLQGGFYGPINRGQLPSAVDRMRKNPNLAGRMNSALDAVIGGSNTIKGFTDQGLPSDPNGWRQPQIKRGGNVFPDWAGGPGGPRAAAEYRRFLQRGVEEEQKSAAGRNRSYGDTRAPSQTQPGAKTFGDWLKMRETEQHSPRDAIDRSLAAQTGKSSGINGSASIKVDVNAPKGTKVGVGYGGIFKHMELTRSVQMEPSEEGPTGPGI